MSKFDIGVMQGRLLPKYKGNYQAHPVNYWQEEFPIASSLGIKCIEFILDFDDYEKNPLMTSNGISEINNISKKNNVYVKSICADFFMKAPLHSDVLEVSNKSKEVLITLIKNSKKIGVKNIVIPCVDQSSIKSEKDLKLFIKVLRNITRQVEHLGINLSLETDLPPNKISYLIKKIDSKIIKVNHDTGNSASLGYDIKEEFAEYGNLISDIHIKDRILNGDSVFFGTGDFNSQDFVECFNSINYNGPIIMQVYRDDEGLEIFKKQFEIINKEIINKI